MLSKLPSFKRYIRPVSIVLILGLVLYVSRYFTIPPCSEIQALINQHPKFAPAMFFVSYVIATIAFVPGTLLTLIAGMAFGTFWGTVIVSASSVTGASFAFLLSRYLIRGLIEEKLSTKSWFSNLKNALNTNGFNFIILVRLVPIFPFNGLNYACGLLPLKFRDYWIGSALGMLPGTIAYVYLGKTGCQLIDLGLSGRLSLKDLPDEVKTNLILCALFLALLSMIPLVFRKLKSIKQ